MKILALDTSTEACSAAVLVDDAVRERFELGAQHSERILPMIAALLEEGGLALRQFDGLAFGRGPGSFTGLRIGAGVAQALAFAADLPVVPVSSLAALAQSQAHGRILAAFDARMSQVYWGAYERDAHGLMRLQGTELVAAPAAVPAPAGTGWQGAGSGWDRYSAALRALMGDRVAGWSPRQFPRAGDVARLGAAGLAAGDGVPAEQALPVYLRDDVARKAGER